MHYKPDASLAFGSVEYIMREVPWGWLVRYMHSTGASAFFIVVYLHMARGLMYGSYRKPRELVWLFGVGIFLCLMGEAFFGYLQALVGAVQTHAKLVRPNRQCMLQLNGSSRGSRMQLGGEEQCLIGEDRQSSIANR